MSARITNRFARWIGKQPPSTTPSGLTLSLVGNLVSLIALVPGFYWIIAARSPVVVALVAVFLIAVALVFRQASKRLSQRPAAVPMRVSRSFQTATVVVTVAIDVIALACWRILANVGQNFDGFLVYAIAVVLQLGMIVAVSRIRGAETHLAAPEGQRGKTESS